MKLGRSLIIGIISIAVSSLLSPAVRADDLCLPNAIDTHYKAIYCGIRQYDNEEADEKLIETIASQYDLDEELVKAILDGNICQKIEEMSGKDQAELSPKIKNACLPKGKDSGTVLEAWNVFTDIQNSYEKEKVIQRSSDSLKFKFKASEQYWNGTLIDAPFDLILDLNLIEIVLFGRKAEWMNDVYSFPKKEEDDGEGGDIPADDLIPEDETDTTGDGTTEDEGDPGLTSSGEGGEEIPADCVSPDDPEADLGNEPGSGYQNPLCGNGITDVLMGEQCDDGNMQSGDGCNQYCQTEATGSNDQCTDPDAITFKSPTANNSGTATGLGDASNGGSGNQSDCPPGTVPKKSKLEGQEADGPDEVPQSPEYPGSFLGGTMKQFADTNLPLCPPGQSPIGIATPNIETENEAGEDEVSITSKDKYLKDDNGNVRCIPTEYCAEFKDVQDFLFGEDWENDPEKVDAASAIESFFCVNIVKENRPQSPYQLNDGCIDCHITAMTDAMQKALETNVTPLKNTTNAFGISSAFGPQFSFNLSTMSLSKLKYNNTETKAKSKKKADEQDVDGLETATPTPVSQAVPRSPLDGLYEEAASIDDSRNEYLEDVRAFNIGGGMIPDQEVGGRVRPLLGQMRDSFMNIEAKFEAVVGATDFQNKKQCPK